MESEEDFKRKLNIYVHFIDVALSGYNPSYANTILLTHRKEIVQVFNFLKHKFILPNLELPKKIYRGVILPQSDLSELHPHHNFAYISCSQDIKVAQSFGDPTPQGFGTAGFDLGNYGYISEINKYEHLMIFHWFLLEPEILGGIFEDEDKRQFLYNQKEIMLIQPDEPLKITPYKMRILRNPTLRLDKDYGKVLTENNIPLRDLSIDDISPNIAYMKLPENGIVSFPPNSYYAFLFESEDDVARFKQEVDVPLFPLGFASHSQGRVSPFKTFYKSPKAKGILGVIWCEVYPKEKTLYIAMMATRPKYERNKINSFLVESIMNKFDLDSVDFGTTTNKGEKFAKKLDKGGKFKRVKNKIVWS